MYRTALVGVDEPGHVEDPLELARALCRPSALISLVRVQAPSGPGGAMPEPDRSADRGGFEGSLYRAARRSRLADTVSITAGSIGRGLGRLAASRRADLLVIGSPHRTPGGTVGLADWLDQAIQHATCGIAVAPRDYCGGAVSTIGVVHDGAAASRRALVAARHLAAEHDADLRVLELATVAGEESAPRPAGSVDALARFSAKVDLLVAGVRGTGHFHERVHSEATLSLMSEVQSPLLLVTPQTRAPLAVTHAPVDEHWLSAEVRTAVTAAV